MSVTPVFTTLIVAVQEVPDPKAFTVLRVYVVVVVGDTGMFVLLRVG